jgi:hypothetical protein
MMAALNDLISYQNLYWRVMQSIYRYKAKQGAEYMMQLLTVYYIKFGAETRDKFLEILKLKYPLDIPQHLLESCPTELVTSPGKPYEPRSQLHNPRHYWANGLCFSRIEE